MDASANSLLEKIDKLLDRANHGGDKLGMMITEGANRASRLLTRLENLVGVAALAKEEEQKSTVEDPVILPEPQAPSSCL